MGAAPALSDLLKFTIEVTKGPHTGERFNFHKVGISVGREIENDIVLSKDPRVSRQHIELKQSLGEFYLINLSQKNFVLLNGQTIASEKVPNYATIQVGDSELRFSFESNQPHPDMVGTSLVAVSSSPQGPLMPKPAPAAVGNSPFVGATPKTPPQRPRPRPRPAGKNKVTSNPRFALFAVIGFIAVAVFLSSLGRKTKPAETKAFRTEEELTVVREEAENELKAFEEHRARMNQQIYQKAYENFLRGYRDFRQGQFVRARESFQVVLNLDPENELARRYWNLSKIRFDETVKFHMLQGRRYLEKQNYRMCKASYQTVMTMLGNDPSNPEYKEALMTHRQCSAAMERRF